MSLPTHDRELDAIVPVHIQAFPGFFMTQLGPRFLREYYRCVLDYRKGMVLTESDVNGCLGFASGFLDPPDFYRELRRRRLRLGLSACAGIVTHPQRLKTLLVNYGRAGGVASRSHEPDTAELSSIAVLPIATGRGVGSRLVKKFVEAAGVSGARRVVLTTDAKENRQVNRFYGNLGFEIKRSFEAKPGRLLNEYVLQIEKA